MQCFSEVDAVEDDNDVDIGSVVDAIKLSEVVEVVNVVGVVFWGWMQCLSLRWMRWKMTMMWVRVTEVRVVAVVAGVDAVVEYGEDLLIDVRVAGEICVDPNCLSVAWMQLKWSMWLESFFGYADKLCDVGEDEDIIDDVGDFSVVRVVAGVEKLVVYGVDVLIDLTVVGDVSVEPLLVSCMDEVEVVNLVGVVICVDAGLALMWIWWNKTMM
ncbi:hypothetical protein P4O66_019091 [Electrophorus voltai]|uniref:Uncharacterized protein n=1 Tax=Electrophorus voltai TaxID=2609070 RepID=A0AAD8YR53_9TELE|nr:hypothetical protein P4O66_019091 [Electrophorus voltai]